MKRLDIPEQVQLFLEKRDASPRVVFRRLRIDAAGASHTHRWHVADRSIERARLTACRIVGEVDALSGGERTAAEADRSGDRQRREQRDEVSLHEGRSPHVMIETMRQAIGALLAAG